ncbi:hypothetical protein GCM10027091_05570 [Streptomyces daliensis]
MFDRVGYERATLSEVSSMAAVSKGALSFHFASKAELADTVQLLACSTARARMEQLRARDVPALQTLIDMTHATAQQLAHDETTRAGVRLTRERCTPSDPSVHSFANWQECFMEVAMEAEKDQSLRRDLAPHSVAALAMSLVSGSQPHQLEPGVEVHTWLSELWELSLPALMAEQSPWPLRAAGSEADWSDALALAPA